MRNKLERRTCSECNDRHDTRDQSDKYICPDCRKSARPRRYCILARRVKRRWSAVYAAHLSHEVKTEQRELIRAGVSRHDLLIVWAPSASPRDINRAVAMINGGQK